MPREPEEYEQAWAQIVADLTTDDPGLAERTRALQADAADEHGSLHPIDGVDTTNASTGSERPDAPLREDPPSAPRPSAAHPSEARPNDAQPSDYRPSDWEDEGHFVPPHPPDIPSGTPVSRLGWAGVIGGPAVMAISALSGWNPPSVVMWGAGAATIAGFITLVWQMPDSRDDGWDDGARL